MPAVIEQLQQMDGVYPDDIAGFRRSSGGSIQGRLLGLDLSICRCEDLPSLDLPANSLGDIDVDYFVTVPGDALWTDPAAVAGALKELARDPSIITISRSLTSGFTPPRYQTLAEDLAVVLGDGGGND
jgi:hypothetical protein